MYIYIFNVDHKVTSSIRKVSKNIVTLGSMNLNLLQRKICKKKLGQTHYGSGPSENGQNTKILFLSLKFAQKCSLSTYIRLKCV